MPAAYFTVSHVHLYCPSSYLATELVDRVLINALTSLREIWNRGENVIEWNRKCLGSKGNYQIGRLG